MVLELVAWSNLLRFIHQRAVLARYAPLAGLGMCGPHRNEVYTNKDLDACEKSFARTSLALFS